MIGNNIWTEDVRALLLHIFSQTMYHDDARIHGSREALARLGRALLEASQSGQGDETSVDMMASDGEGYHVLIQPMSDQQIESGPLPYSTPGLPWEHDRCFDCPKNEKAPSAE